MTDSCPTSGSRDAVRAYLIDLERALVGADPALIHDALDDAETHLLAAVASGRSEAEAIRDFGEASSVAAAYLGMSDRAHALGHGPVGTADAGGAGAVAPKAFRWRNIPFVGVWYAPEAWASLAMLVFGAVFAVAAFLWVAVLGSLSVLLISVFVGAPLMLLMIKGVRYLTLAWGKILSTVTRVRMPTRMSPVAALKSAGMFQRACSMLADLRSRMRLMFWVANLPVALLLSVAFIIPLAHCIGIFNRALFNPAIRTVANPLFVHRTRLDTCIDSRFDDAKVKEGQSGAKWFKAVNGVKVTPVVGRDLIYSVALDEKWERRVDEKVLAKITATAHWYVIEDFFPKGWMPNLLYENDKTSVDGGGESWMSCVSRCMQDASVVGDKSCDGMYEYMTAREYGPELTGIWTSRHLRFNLFGRLCMFAIGTAYLTVLLWLARGTAKFYAQVVKSLQIIRPDFIT